MIVLDCSAAVEIVLKTDNGNCIYGLIEPNEKVITTDLFRIEIINALSKYVKSGKITLEESFRLLARATHMIDEFVPMQEYCIGALKESTRLNYSAYDMLYLLLAQRRQAILATLDMKLIKLCEQQGVECIHILDADYLEANSAVLEEIDKSLQGKSTGKH